MEDEFFEFEVKCHEFPGQRYKMQVRFTTLSNGRRFNMPCNGCEFMSGADICMDCVTAINSIFFKDPDCRRKYIDPLP